MKTIREPWVKNVGWPSWHLNDEESLLDKTVCGLEFGVGGVDVAATVDIATAATEPNSKTCENCLRFQRRRDEKAAKA